MSDTCISLFICISDTCICLLICISDTCIFYAYVYVSVCMFIHLFMPSVRSLSFKILISFLKENPPLIFMILTVEGLGQTLGLKMKSVDSFCVFKILNQRILVLGFLVWSFGL